VEARAELGVGHRGEERHRAVAQEDEQKAGPGHARGDARQDEDAGPNHGADADIVTEKTDISRASRISARAPLCGSVNAFSQDLRNLA
jgi:hypothetical protein